METSLDESRERILIADIDPLVVKEVRQLIKRQLPDATVASAANLDEYQRVLDHGEFDIVILDYDLSGTRGASLIQELKLRDHEPTVLMVSNQLEPKAVSAAYDAGCYRYLIKEGAWIDELGPALRHLMRIRRLESENASLLAKLTEANSLLEEKNRRLDEFSATVAHDIRGPLGGICMKLEFILDHYKAGLDAKVAQMLERGLQASLRLTHVVQAMYDFAKLGSKATKMAEVDLRELVNEVISDMSFDDKLDIQIGVAENLPTVWGNSELLRRAFINLIGNAVKYSNKKEIVVNVGLRSVVDRTLAQFCEIFVQDNGRGIPPNELKDVFSMFGRGAGTSQGTEGLGIGLSVVQRIVELHFGKVAIESVVGQGSTFVLTLPLQKIELASDWRQS